MTDSNIKQVIEEIKKIPDNLEAGADQVLSDAVESIKGEMSVPGSAITYPVQWDSERQRRAFFATNGFGKGIPYKRTDGYVAAWRHDVIPFGHQLFGPHPAGAIGGTPAGWQSRIHRNRWNYLLKALADELARMPDRIRDMLRVFGGKQ